MRFGYGGHRSSLAKAKEAEEANAEKGIGCPAEKCSRRKRRVCACVWCVTACVRACVCVCARARAYACVHVCIARVCVYEREREREGGRGGGRKRARAARAREREKEVERASGIDARVWQQCVRK
eukprot:6177320-Pleurochrysis_carterae.AAC.1